MTLRVRSDRGATLVEYALLVALLLVASMGVIRSLQNDSKAKVVNRSDGIGQPAEENALSGPSGGGGGGDGGTTGGGGGGSATVHVGQLSGVASSSPPDWSATVTITVLDVNGDPVQGATVTGVWSLPGGGTTCSPTSSLGQCSITSASFKQNGNGSVPQLTFTLSSLSGASMTYDASADTSNQVTINNPSCNPWPDPCV